MKIKIVTTIAPKMYNKKLAPIDVVKLYRANIFTVKIKTKGLVINKKG